MRISSTSKPSSTTKDDISRHSTNLTPFRYRKHERRVATWVDFRDVHLSIAQQQFDYISHPRRNSVKPRGVWHRVLEPHQAYLLPAANMAARISFAKLALAHLRQHPELYRGPICFVTISPRRYVSPLEFAPQIDIVGLQKLTGQVLAGFSFLGMIDFALFKGWGTDGIRALHNQVGAHTHQLVFGATKPEVDAAAAKMGLSFVDIKGDFAVHVKEVNFEQVEGYLLYLLKAPLFEYNVRTGYRLLRDPHTGQLTVRKNIGSRPLRPCDQLRMGAVLGDMYLDELIFGQGVGTSLVREIRKEARAPIRRKNEIAAANGYGPERQIAVTLNIRPEDREPVSSAVRGPSQFLPRLRRRWPIMKPTDDLHPQ